MQGRKIHPDFEHPFDNFLIDIAEYQVNPVLYQMGFTANMITILSFITGITSVIFAYKQFYLVSAIFIFISYFLDCADGNFARKYNQVSIFGDILDHVSDITKYSLLALVIIFNKKISIRERAIIITILAIAFCGSCIHLGCQEIVYNKPSHSLSLQPLQLLCTNSDAKNFIKKTRHGGAGLFNLIFIFVLIWLALSHSP